MGRRRVRSRGSKDSRPASLRSLAEEVDLSVRGKAGCTTSGRVRSIVRVLGSPTALISKTSSRSTFSPSSMSRPGLGCEPRVDPLSQESRPGPRLSAPASPRSSVRSSLSETKPSYGETFSSCRVRLFVTSQNMLESSTPTPPRGPAPSPDERSSDSREGPPQRLSQTG